MHQAVSRKKAKTLDASQLAPLKPLDFTLDQREALRSSFQSGDPFPHVAISNLCDDAFLRQVRHEIITQLKADYKETDIFKVYQTGDLANLDVENEAIEHLVKLRDTLYSSEFRSFVTHVTGCPPLTDGVDCSCNIYPDGGHLLCHDDVIGTRCVSYVLYLTDPETEWREADGGSLELYPIDSNQELLPDAAFENALSFVEPSCLASKKILPKWNQMVLFRVEPNVSFHSVEEVHTSDNHRLSVSGWFHTDEEHLKITRSSLNQLRDSRQQPSLFQFEDIPCRESLREGDVEVLKNWINPIYLAPSSIEKIYRSFKEEGSIQLQNFLKEEKAQGISNIVKEIKTGGMANGRGWSIVGPPHKRRHLLFSGQSSEEGPLEETGAFLHLLEKELFRSTSFRQWLHVLAGVDCLGGTSDIRCFRPGHDYTVALYCPEKEDTLDATLCFVDDAEEDDRLQWDLGEAGGYEAYLLADADEQKPADVYRVDDTDSGVLSVHPVSNTLNLVLADDGLIKFVKYVGTRAPGCRWDIACSYRLGDDASPVQGEDTKDD